MKLLSDERVGVFFDWENINTSLKVISSITNRDVTIPWEKLRALFHTDSLFVRFHFYAGEYTNSAFRDLIRKLRRLSFNVFVKKSQMVDRDKGWSTRKNCDVEIAVDIMSSMTLFDHIIIFSGGGDFTYLIDKLKSSGKRVTVVSHFSPKNWDNNNASVALIQDADGFTQLEDFLAVLEEWQPQE